MCDEIAPLIVASPARPATTWALSLLGSVSHAPRFFFFLFVVAAACRCPFRRCRHVVRQALAEEAEATATTTRVHSRRLVPGGWCRRSVARLVPSLRRSVCSLFSRVVAMGFRCYYPVSISPSSPSALKHSRCWPSPALPCVRRQPPFEATRTPRARQVKKRVTQTRRESDLDSFLGFQVLGEFLQYSATFFSLQHFLSRPIITLTRRAEAEIVLLLRLLFD